MRATLRSERLPKSRCTLMIAVATSIDLVRPDEGHALGHGRKGLLGAGRHAHAAADQHVVADDAKVLANGHQAQVVGIQVDAIVAGQADGGLELARQIGRAVDRLDLVPRRARRRTARCSPVSGSVSQIS